VLTLLALSHLTLSTQQPPDRDVVGLTRSALRTYFEYESESFIIMQALDKQRGLLLDSAVASSAQQQGLSLRCTQHPARFGRLCNHYKIVRRSTTTVGFRLVVPDLSETQARSWSRSCEARRLTLHCEPSATVPIACKGILVLGIQIPF